MNHNVVLRLGSVLVRRWRLTTACGAVLLVATSVVVMKVGSRHDVAMQAAADVALA
ncbi:MAG: hypothetical protein IMZ44_22680, partial [Planctomycetes bacterium]|nr:hypothetical protein [Planctomycetota bacterium]